MTRSPGFDPEAYIREVLRPIRVGGRLPSLVKLYALDDQHLEMGNPELVEWIEEHVVGLWHRQDDDGVINIAEVCRHLIQDHEKLRHTPGYRQASWWHQQIRAESPGASNPAPPPGLVPAPPTPAKPPRPQVRDAEIADQPVVGAESAQPSPAVLGVKVEQRDDRVIVSWQVPSGASSGVRFTVDRLPGQGMQGRQWTPSGGLIEDRDPPPGRRLAYRVAMRDSVHGISSTGQASTVFTPPVSEFVATQDGKGTVVGSWRGAAEISATQVWRAPAGSSAAPSEGELIPSRRSGFHDPSAPVGRHAYSVVPIYRDPESHTTYRGRLSTVDVEVVAPPPAPRVAVWEGQQPGAAELALCWDQLPAGVSLLLRRVAADPAGSVGDWLTIGDARAVGEPVTDGEGLTGTSARVTMPAGRWLLIPFSVAGSLAVRGQAVTVAVVPPMKSKPEFSRHGPNVRVSWEWPTEDENIRLARVVWRTGDIELVREVTLSEYKSLGYVVFQGSGPAEVQVSSVVRDAVGEMLSAPVLAHAPAQTPTLTFHVHRVWPWLPMHVRPFPPHGPRWWCATRRIVFTADLPCTGLRLEIYVRTPIGGPGSEVPVRVIEDLDLGPDRPYEMTLTLPDLSALDRPLYLACRGRTMSDSVRINEFASTGREIRPCFR